MRNKMKNISPLLMLVLATLPQAFSQQFERFASPNPCILKSTCQECIQTMGCAWCAQIEFGDQRCFMPKLSPNVKCDPLIDLVNMNETISNRGLSNSQVTSHENVVQIAPQHIRLSLRINTPYRIGYYYRQAVDNPVDLYYLMDLSYSMEDDLQKLGALGLLLSDTMTKITSNFRLGFGSFVDKVVMPYVSTAKKDLDEPCGNCTAPFGFKNVMPLSPDTHTFSSQVRNTKVSGNLDAPEGGFDAIMQAIVCRKEIGWREKARKLLVFSTDATFHYAGDGKLGGIVKPNDGCCHLDDAGFMYTYSSLQDYPSISQLNLKVKENAINVIFAVTSTHYQLYKRLGDHIEGSSCGTLSNDSSNIVDLIEDQYNKITSSIEIKDTASDAIFKVTYYSNCLDERGPLRQTNKCDGLKVGQTVQFQIDVEVISCPPDRADWDQRFVIYPVGVSENLTVDVELQCGCLCEIPGQRGYYPKSPSCNNRGDLKCGVCECEKGYVGRTCECNSESMNESAGTNKCRPANATEDCSGNGDCICGQCICKEQSVTEKFFGKYCECDNFSCRRTNELLCSGLDHGTCECNGQCDCRDGWSGLACECTTRTDTCMKAGSKEVCSGRGECKCGKCAECRNVDGVQYSGRFCEKCSDNLCDKCKDFSECVQCAVHGTGIYSKEQCRELCSHKINAIEMKEMEKYTTHDNFCLMTDNEDCRFSFIYEEGEKGKYVITAGNERDCPPQPHVLGVVFSLIGTIVLFGLGVLITWKVFTTISDRREFAKFEKEIGNAKWERGENPIYKEAISTYKNPTYCGK